MELAPPFDEVLMLLVCPTMLYSVEVESKVSIDVVWHIWNEIQDELFPTFSNLQSSHWTFYQDIVLDMSDNTGIYL